MAGREARRTSFTRCGGISWRNREGLDSVATCVAGQIEQAARWLAACGVEVPRDAQGKPVHPLEISPLFAADPRSLAARRGTLPDRIDEPTLLA